MAIGEIPDSRDTVVHAKVIQIKLYHNHGLTLLIIQSSLYVVETITEKVKALMSS